MHVVPRIPQHKPLYFPPQTRILAGIAVIAVLFVLFVQPSTAQVREEFGSMSSANIDAAETTAGVVSYHLTGTHPCSGHSNDGYVGRIPLGSGNKITLEPFQGAASAQVTIHLAHPVPSLFAPSIQADIEVGSGSSWVKVPNSPFTIAAFGCITVTFTVLTNQQIRIVNLSSSYSLDVDYVAIDAGALPVELSAFSAVAREQDVLLQWTTTTELNNYGFDIQRRRADSDPWQTIGFVHGAGTSQHPINYAYHDVSVLREVTRYRLRQTDRDGTTSFSSEVLVFPHTEASDAVPAEVFPNPLRAQAHLSLMLEEAQPVSISIHNLLGQEVAQVTEDMLIHEGHTVLPLPVSGLQPGTYLVLIRTRGGMRSVRITKSR